MRNKSYLNKSSSIIKSEAFEHETVFVCDLSKFSRSI
jgi:hypothetical protein